MAGSVARNAGPGQFGRLQSTNPALREGIRIRSNISPEKRDLLPETLVLQKFPSLPTQSKTVLSPRQGARRKSAAIFNCLTEAEVIARAQAGDVVCFEALYAQHKRRVFSLCLRMSKNYSEAEDYTQEAFLQLYRKIASFRAESAFSTWLHRLAVNVVLMHFRKKGLVETPLEEILEPQHEDAPRKEFGGTDISLVGSIDRLTLERAIAELPPGYRMIFVLHDIEGYEHNEIAEMLGCSIGNSKSQLHKARMKLRILLSSCPPSTGFRVHATDGV